MPIKFRTWADHPQEKDKPDSRSIDRMKERISTPGWCCNKRVLAADMLVYVGHLPAATLNKIKARMPKAWNQAAAQAGYGLSLRKQGEVGLYLCDGCRETLRREKVLLPTEMPNWKLDPTSPAYVKRFGGG